ncbi:MAG: putative selenate reductase subunit YgfK, partial [Oscillospiraceae bacterium]
GVERSKFYKNNAGTSIKIFGESISSPIGPAAGPNSQLANNIIAAYFGGSRFMELKTVQKMDGDELRACVPRPCINAEDEGYNVEWSTELTVPQALEDYVKAWVALHVLSKEAGIATKRDFVFNMSVGYDLDGIKTEKINNYIEGMKNASNTDVFKDAIAWLRSNLGRFANVTEADIDAISPNVSSSITLSTLHGCPPQEIERIAKYLLDEKKVHTFVKCNPTLLGYETARRLLDEMGFNYISFDEHHFQNDLQYDDAIAMLTRLVEYAKERALSFGVKITNTFPVQIKREELPGEEMYMSGRSLFPLSITVAKRLSQHFKGQLPISYSGGADAFNIEEIFNTGIQPITVATTILKPGGYERLQQLATLVEPMMKAEWLGVDVEALTALADNLPAHEFYRKDARPVASRKTEVPLGLFDCFQAPCKQGGCPIEQQIPEYLRLVSQGKYKEAFDIISIDNANPTITGTICSHPCQYKCTRLDYDSSLQIRHSKLIASDAAQQNFIDAIEPAALRTGKKAVVIGAGPAGVSAALFLRRNGMEVTVREKREKPFGIVTYVIPEFRIAEEAIMRDYQMAVKAGVRFEFGVQEDVVVAALKNEFDYVLLAIGAWKEGSSPVKQGQDKLRDALEFLEDSKANNCNISLGSRVAVIGGGDVAMD